MNVQELIEKVKEEYTWEDILNILDDEILNWDYGYSESEIEEEYACRWDFYREYNNGEAENAVVDALLLEMGTSRNELHEQSDGADLLIFEEWLEDYTLHRFDV